MSKLDISSHDTRSKHDPPEIALPSQHEQPAPATAVDLHNSQITSSQARHSPKKPNLLDRLSFNHGKSLKDVAVSDLERRSRKADRKRQKDEEELRKAQKRQESRERAAKTREEKAEKKAREKTLKNYYGIRGFDPNAGMLGPQRQERSPARGRNGQLFEHGLPSAARSPQHRHHQRDESDRTDDVRERQSTPSLRPRQTWGVEIGKPNHHEGRGHFAGRHGDCGGLYRSP